MAVNRALVVKLEFALEKSKPHFARTPQDRKQWGMLNQKHSTWSGNIKDLWMVLYEGLESD